MTLEVLLGFISAAMAGSLVLANLFLRPRKVADWAFLLGMATLAAESIFGVFTLDASSTGRLVFWQNWRLVGMSFLPGIWLLFSLTYGRGNYKEFLQKWKFPLTAAFLLPPVLTLFFTDKLVSETGLIKEQIPLDWAGMTLYAGILISVVLILMNLERTYRAAVGTMRWRVKYMILGLGVLFAVRAYSSSQCLVFRAENLPLLAVNSAALIVCCLLIFRWFLRSGHFEVSIYPSHTVLHHSFTIFLAGIYLLVVGGLAKAVSFFGGDAQFPLKAFVVLLALVLLTMVLLSDRARLYSKQFVSRHFQRPLYNYRSVWRNFTEGTASCVERNDLCGAVVKLVSEIFQVLSVTVWMVDEKDGKLTFAASSSLSELKGENLKPLETDAQEIIRALRNHPEPLDIDRIKQPWAEALRNCQPSAFRSGGHRVCVPMMARGELLGIMLLGDRVAGTVFTTQDFDLLKSVGDEVAASLMNIELSQRVVQAKELEAFQTMSAFFVHDLKNTASTLSLMLQNFPVHYNDPAFREDALRGMGKAVHHVNDIIRRLTQLREEMAITPEEIDLNQLVGKVLAGFQGTPNLTIVQDFQPLPKPSLDAEQIEKVILNLVLNAKEALPAQGEIRVATLQKENWAIISVSDNGCGMTRDFLERSLFRAFQTTKKHGIGIGMFQSKMIVEAHRGKIEVESEPGRGTTFRVLLPLTA
ncbi:MAG: XrtA/PEP-CTERM system histidine kinase PrsK [Verrucomicrobiota bacterium]